MNSAHAFDALLRPRSVALVGVSAKPGSAGQVVLGNLLNGGYAGAVHLVGRSGGELQGRPILTDVAQLPEGVELAVLLLPADAALEAVRSCIARRVRAAVCFASGFAEMGEAGREQQREMARIAREGGLTLLGPNTVGYFNYVDAFYLMMVKLVLPPKLDPAAGPAVAVVAQSGGIGAHVAASLQARDVPLAYMVTTGNEAQLGLAECVAFLANDPHTTTMAIYAEQIRDASAFRAAVRHARERGKTVVMLHPGRSESSQAAAQSHTGALAGNHAVMQLMAEHAGVLVVDSLEELIDVTQLMLRFPAPATGGLGLVTASGALCGIAQDYVEPLGLALPPLGEAGEKRLRELLPPYTPPRNPLDLGTEIDRTPELIAAGVSALMADDQVGGVLVSLPLPAPAASVVWLQQFADGGIASSKPCVLVMHNEDVPFAPEFTEAARRHRAVLLRSPERAMRALARVMRFARGQAQAAAPAPTARAELPPLGAAGAQPEWLGKQVLRAIGLRTPEGALAASEQEAARIAARIGYPVALKAQAAQLAHKSEVGGVLLALADEAALRRGWQQLHENLRRAGVPFALDGVLVERMAPRGLELVVGATRDAQWGPVLMVGLGGIWVEALGDVKLLPPDLPRAAIVQRLRELKGAKLLAGFRGAPAVDLDAVADAVAGVGRLMLERPGIAEIDVNPLVALPRGEGAIALDALIVTG